MNKYTKYQPAGLEERRSRGVVRERSEANKAHVRGACDFLQHA